MPILQEILENLPGDAPITEVRRGIHSTAVVSRFCGLSSTMFRDACHEREGAEPEKPFTEMTARELARYAFSDDVSKASLGLAAINSLIEIRAEECMDIDGLKLVREIGVGKNISVIGHFPFLEALGEVARNLWIIEKHPLPGRSSGTEQPGVLPQSDIVVVTATTLINHTLPGRSARAGKGASECFWYLDHPYDGVLFDHGIDALFREVW